MLKKPITIALILLILISHVREIAQMMLPIHINANIMLTFLTANTKRYLSRRYKSKYRSTLIAVMVTKDTEQKK